MSRSRVAAEVNALSQRPLLLSSLLFLLALGLRLLAIGRYITPDELIWVYRSLQFHEALYSANWSDTLVAGHPGVTTVWLGNLAMSAQLALQPSSREAYDWLSKLAYLTPDNMEAMRQLAVFLDAGRVALGVVNAAGIVAIYWLLRALSTDRMALIAGLLLAIEPFFSGLSGLLHVDGLLTTAAIISLLALALGSGWGKVPISLRARYAWLAISGTAAALAALSKSPGLLLLPVAALALFSLAWPGSNQTLGQRVGIVTAAAMVWFGSFLLVSLLLYPALWVVPREVFTASGGDAGRHFSEALRPTFFLGRVAFDHGPLFYPVVLLWRLSPLVFGGLILLLIILIRGYLPSPPDGRLLGLLVLWVVLFLLGITLTAKKFDRYALPLFPALAILASVGLATYKTRNSRAGRVLLPGLVVLEILMIAMGLPQQLATYNPLVGGPLTAQYVLPLGWGEAVSASGRWLATQPGASTQAAISGLAPSLAPFYPGTTLFSETAEPSEADHIIITAGSLQTDPQAAHELARTYEPIHDVRYSLLTQAKIFANPDPQLSPATTQDLEAPIAFDGRMALLGQGLHAAESEILYTARWQKTAADPRLIVKLQLSDAAGSVWQTLETDLLNEVYFYPRDWQREETPQVTYLLERPAGMPPGDYSIHLSLVDHATGALLPLAIPGVEGRGVTYEVGTLTLDQRSSMDAGDLLNSDRRSALTWLDGDLTLLGTADLPDRIAAGSDLVLDLVWQTDGELPSGLQGALELGSTTVVAPLGAADSAAWPDDAAFRQMSRFSLPADLPEGDYSLRLRLLDRNGLALTDDAAEIGRLRVDAVKRLFSLPDEIGLPLDDRFEPGILLQGLTPGTLKGQAGSTVDLTLYWQTDYEPDELISAFVHVLDARGEIVAQSDQWPGGLPSQLWSEGQVIIDTHRLVLPADLVPGDFEVAVGLYTAADGRRLTAVDSVGQPWPEDRVILPTKLRVED